MTFKSYRDESRINYGKTQDSSLSIEQLNCGSLMRIADATEKMCADREKLERDYKYMRNNRDEWRQRAEAAERSNAALRGVITKTKRNKEQP